MNGQKQFDYAAQSILDGTTLDVCREQCQDMAAGLIAAASRLTSLVAENPDCDDFRHVLRGKIHSSCPREHLHRGYSIMDNLLFAAKEENLERPRKRKKNAVIRKAEELVDALKMYLEC